MVRGGVGRPKFWCGLATKRAATLFRQLGVPALASEAVLRLARLEAEREHYDQAVSLLEQAESWLAEADDPDRRGHRSQARENLSPGPAARFALAP